MRNHIGSKGIVMWRYRVKPAVAADPGHGRGGRPRGKAGSLLQKSTQAELGWTPGSESLDELYKYPDRTMEQICQTSRGGVERKSRLALLFKCHFQL